MNIRLKLADSASQAGAILNYILSVGGNWWQWYWSWRFRLPAAAGLCLAALVVAFGPRLLRRYRHLRAYHRGWVSYLVRSEERRRKHRSPKFLVSEWLRSLPRPGRTSFLATAIAILLTYPLERLTAILISYFLSSRSEASLTGILGNLLPAQVTVAGVALPILVFFIERAKEEEETRLPASEVLVHATWIFPAAMFALLASVRMAVDYALRSASEAILIIDVLLFSATVLLTMRAVFQTLRLSFSRALLKGRGLALIRERAALSAERSIQIRLAENILVRGAKERRVGFWLFGVDRDVRERFHVIEDKRRGRLTDVNLVGLEQFLGALRYRPTRVASAIDPVEAPTDDSDMTDELRGKEEERVFLARRMDEVIDTKFGALILVEKTMVESFETLDQDYWLRWMFRVER